MLHFFGASAATPREAYSHMPHTERAPQTKTSRTPANAVKRSIVPGKQILVLQMLILPWMIVKNIIIKKQKEEKFRDSNTLQSNFENINPSKYLSAQKKQGTKWQSYLKINKINASKFLNKIFCHKLKIKKTKTKQTICPVVTSGFNLQYSNCLVKQAHSRRDDL